MVTVTYIMAAVVLLGLCIFIHELGHLLGGKLVGIKAQVFSLGYGKGFIKKQVGDTTYQITLIPLGGYCQFYGEDASEDRTGKESYSFLSAHPLKRIFTVLMGPMFNLFFGIFLFFVMNLIGYTKETNRIYIPEYYKSGSIVSPAYKAGLKDGDAVIDINGKKITDFSGIQTAMFFSEGKEAVVKISRDGREISYTIKPEPLGDGIRFGIGVMPYGTKVAVAGVLDKGPAKDAGILEMDEILSVDGKSVSRESDFIEYINKSGNKDVNLKISRSGKDINLTVKPALSNVYSIQPKDRADVKEKKKAGSIPLFDAEQLEKLVAKKKLKINGTEISDIAGFNAVFEKNKNKTVSLESGNIKYEGVLYSEKIGRIGIYPAVKPEMVDVKFGVPDAFVNSLTEPYEFIVMNLKGFGMLFSGKMNVRENLSGPIRIGKLAGDVVYYKGISAFIILMAKISIILMVMNLLPIPMVDGSQILIFTFEMIRGKPINDKILERIQTVGMAILIALGVFVIINDIIMLPVIQKLIN
jgi:regulator of sigma E protease